MCNASEHWRTLCVCSICCQTPESTPIYRCKTGHNYCKSCFEELKGKLDDAAYCQICGSKEFQEDVKSADFLRKLRVKPGIGRSCRYKIKRPESPHSRPSSCERWRQGQSEEFCPADESVKESVTVEKLFRLPREDLEELFAQETRKKIRNPINTPSTASTKLANPFTTTTNDRDRGDTASVPSSIWLSRNSRQFTHPFITIAQQHESKKPVKCPHDPCKKYVAISTFLNHYKHEHGDIPRYSVDRGKNLWINCDASIVEHNVTFCIGLVTVYDVAKIEAGARASHGLANTCKKLKTRVPLDTFWLMVSGSPQEQAYGAFVLYWLFVCNNNPYTCTMDLMSAKDSVSFSVFCGVNGSGDSQEIEDVAKRLNCLCLTKGAMLAVLEDGADMKLGITVH